MSPLGYIEIMEKGLSGEIALALSAVSDGIDRALAQAGRKDPVRIMAVTKTHPASTVAAAIAAGIDLIGENRVSEGGRKIAALGRDAAEFHMIGPLHRGEVRQACRDFQSIDSIDREVILEAVAARRAMGATPSILIEVDTAPGEGKHGFPPDFDLLCRIVDRAAALGVPPAGFMTVGPLIGGKEASRRSFALLRDIRDRVGRATGLDLPELSMGMSDDWFEAVLEGSTTVRLGRALFGERSGLTP